VVFLFRSNFAHALYTSQRLRAVNCLEVCGIGSRCGWRISLIEVKRAFGFRAYTTRLR
jgi:hypothetical protein